MSYYVKYRALDYVAADSGKFDNTELIQPHIHSLIWLEETAVVNYPKYRWDFFTFVNNVIGVLTFSRWLNVYCAMRKAIIWNSNNYFTLLFLTMKSNLGYKIPILCIPHYSKTLCSGCIYNMNKCNLLKHLCWMWNI